MAVMPGAEPFFSDGGPVGVLVCHGYTSTPQSMRPWAEHLAAQGYTVRLPRLPGHGTTWQELNRTRWQDWYAALDREFLYLQERCERVFAVGLSMGGLLATRVAQVHPGGIAGLVLVNPIFAHDAKALLALPILRHVLPSLPGIASDIKKPGITELAYDRNPLQAMYSQTQLWDVVGKQLPDVTVPILLFRSRTDHVVPPVSAQHFLAHVSSSDVTDIVLEDSFHVATLDNDAQRVFDESVAFIERLRQG